MAPPLAAKLSFTSSPDGKALVHIDAAPPEARRQSQVQGPDVVTGVKIDDDTAVTRLQAKQRGKLARRKTQERMAVLDDANDGAIKEALSTAEGRAEFKILFDSLDADGDGAVSSKEWGRGVGRNKAIMQRYFGGATVGEVGRMFSKINTDGDAKLTWAEWCAAVGVDDEDVGGAGLVVTGVRVDDGTAATRIQAKHRGKLSRQKTQGLKDSAAAAAGAPDTGEAVAEDEKIVVRITRGDEMTALDGENRELRARVEGSRRARVEVNNLAAALPTADLPRPTTAVREATVQKSELRRLCRLAGIETSISDEVDDLVAKLDAGGSPLKGTISTGFAKGGGGGKGGGARPLSARASMLGRSPPPARPAPLRPQSAVAARRAPATVGAAPRHRAAPTYDYTSSPQAGRPAERRQLRLLLPPRHRAAHAGRVCQPAGAAALAVHQHVRPPGRRRGVGGGGAAGRARRARRRVWRVARLAAGDARDRDPGAAPRDHRLQRMLGVEAQLKESAQKEQQRAVAAMVAAQQQIAALHDKMLPGVGVDPEAPRWVRHPHRRAAERGGGGGARPRVARAADDGGPRARARDAAETGFARRRGEDAQAARRRDGARRRGGGEGGASVGTDRAAAPLNRRAVDAAAGGGGGAQAAALLDAERRIETEGRRAAAAEADLAKAREEIEALHAEAEADAINNRNGRASSPDGSMASGSDGVRRRSTPQEGSLREASFHRGGSAGRLREKVGAAGQYAADDDGDELGDESAAAAAPPADGVGRVGGRRRGGVGGGAREAAAAASDGQQAAGRGRRAQEVGQRAQGRERRPQGRRRRRRRRRGRRRRPRRRRRSPTRRWCPPRRRWCLPQRLRLRPSFSSSSRRRMPRSRPRMPA